MGFIYSRDCENLLLCSCFERTGAGLGRWPQILDSTLGGSEFQTEVKKILSFAYTAKHMESSPGPLSHEQRSWLRQRGFLNLRERSSLSKYPGAGIHPAGRVFLQLFRSHNLSIMLLEIRPITYFLLFEYSICIEVYKLYAL